MKKITSFCFAAGIILCLAVPRAFAAGNGQAAFDRLTSLAGHWESQSSNRQKSTLDLELTSGGTALIEKFQTTEDGKSVEMITMYYLDGDQLKLTHYCMAGNQPTLRGTYSPADNTITFDFIAATNLKTPGDGHMHHAVYTFLDNDHFKTYWTFMKDQKESFSEDVTFTRVK